MRRHAGFAALIVMAIAAAWLALDEAPPKSTAPQDCDTAGTCRPKADKAKIPSGSGFDFYVLSLSWSPSYCQSDEGAGNRQQCAADKDYGLVVHGLWPQNERGYPEFCDSREPERVADGLGRSLFDIMPGMGLIGHQWRKHGRCTSLSQTDYFGLVRTAWNRIALPAALRDSDRRRTLDVAAIATDLRAANPGLTRSALTITCDGDRLDEIRFCLSKDLSFRDCGEAGRRDCRRKTVTLPAAR